MAEWLAEGGGGGVCGLPAGAHGGYDGGGNGVGAGVGDGGGRPGAARQRVLHETTVAPPEPFLGDV